MKKWLVEGKWGVVEVEVLGTYPHAGAIVAVVVPNVGPDDVRASDLYNTEAEARREHVDREACALEEEADRHDRQRVDAETLAKGHMDDAAWNAAKAAECRARAKGLRDALVEFAVPVKWVPMDEALEMYPGVKDATEGRR